MADASAAKKLTTSRSSSTNIGPFSAKAAKTPRLWPSRVIGTRIAVRGKVSLANTETIGIGSWSGVTERITSGSRDRSTVATGPDLALIRADGAPHR